MIATPYLLYLGHSNDHAGIKTSRGLAVFRPEVCVGEFRHDDCRLTLDLPRMDFTTAVAAGARTLILGVANAGGTLGEDMVADAIAAMEAGLDIASGLRRPDRGAVTLPDGSPLGRGLRRSIRQGVAIVSGDRKRFGVMLDKPIWENVAQVRAIGLRRQGGFVSTPALRERAGTAVARLGIKAPSVEQHVGTLSGGNQQKVVFAKWLDAEPSVILLDDPTRGIDVGAKAEIYDVMHEQARNGAVQLVSSSDPLELAAVCDEVVVFFEGRICGRLSGEELSANRILEVMNTGSCEPVPLADPGTGTLPSEGTGWLPSPTSSVDLE